LRTLSVDDRSPASIDDMLLPENVPVFAANDVVVNHPVAGFAARSLPTVNSYAGPSGCYVACYSRDPEGAVYSVGGGILVKGQLRVPGHYSGRICLPTGSETKDISAAPDFKKLCAEAIPACKDGCWGGGDTGGWFGVQAGSASRVHRR
jgi:hypothetical protein